MTYRVWIFILLALSVSQVQAQRPFGTIDPTEIDESLKFDVNNIPVDGNVLETSSPSIGGTIDLNFSPNIVITPDSSRGFVAYSGSDRVMVFDPKTGEIIKLVEVGPNPGQLSITPDGKKILLPCIHLEENMPTTNSSGALVASIARIDVNTLDVKTTKLSDVFLSFANNIVFSADGKTAYLASLVTDDLIRINVDSLEESGSRLEFTPGTRPASISTAPDSSYLAVVLVGSTSLPRDEFPDSVTLVDPVNFTILETLSPPTGSRSAPDNFHFLHDFTAVTIFSISSDGRYGVIADQQISNISPLPELSSDRVWLFDFETNQFNTDPVPVAGLAAGTYYAPTGEFVVVGALAVSFVDPVEATARTVFPTRSDFRSRSKPAFSNNDKLMFLAAPMTDSILVFDLESLEVLNAIEVGGDVEREVGREIDGVLTTGIITYSSAPLYLALAPDGEVLTIVNYNANTVELLEDSERFFIPEFVTSSEGENGEPGLFTGLALTNVSDLEADVILSAYSGSGFLFTDNLQTEDRVEFENPTALQLAPDTQIARTIEEFFRIDIEPGDGDDGGTGQGDGGEDNEEDETSAPGTIVTGWLDIDTDQPEIGAFSLIGDRNLTRMDGSIAVRNANEEIILPEVRYEEGLITEITVLNPHLTNIRAVVQLVNDKGQLVEEFTRALPPRTSFTRFVKDPDPDTSADIGIFPESSFEPCTGGSGNEDEGDDKDEADDDTALHCGFEQGYMIVKTEALSVTSGLSTEEGRKGPSVVASERYYDSERMAVLNGFGRNLDSSQTTTQYYLPQVTSFEGSQTFIQLVNPTTEWLNLSLTLKDDQGQDIAAPISLEIRSGHSLKQSLQELFSLTDPGHQVSGWVFVEADKPGLVGDAELQLFEGLAMTTVPFQDIPSSNLLFSHVAQGLGMSTGLAIINTEEVAASVDLSVFDPDGNLVDHTEFSIPPRGRDTRLLKEYFATFDEQLGGYITLDSDRDVVGLELFYADNLEFISAVLPQ